MIATDPVSAPYEMVWSWLSGATWQTALVACIALLICKGLTKAPAAVRHAILLVALLKFATPPWFLPNSGALGVVPFPASQSTAASQNAAASLNTAGEPELPRHPDSDSTTPPNDSLLTAISQVDQTTAQSTIGATTPAPPEAQTERVPSTVAAAIPALAPKPGAASPTEAPSRRFERARSIALIVWLAGALSIATLLLVRSRRLAGMLRRTQALHDPRAYAAVRKLGRQLHLRQTPKLRVSDEATAPFACGVFRPMVVLPRALLTGLSDQELYAVFGHELAHIRRRDAFVDAIQWVLAIGWWFHPLYWIVHRSLRATREEACDDLLLTRTRLPAESYCRTLIAVARARALPPLLPAALPMVASEHALARRFRRIMDPKQQRTSDMSHPWKVVLFLGAAAALPGVSTETSASVQEGPETLKKPKAISWRLALQDAPPEEPPPVDEPIETWFAEPAEPEEPEPISFDRPAEADKSLDEVLRTIDALIAEDERRLELIRAYGDVEARLHRLRNARKTLGGLGVHSYGSPTEITAPPGAPNQGTLRIGDELIEYYLQNGEPVDEPNPDEDTNAESARASWIRVMKELSSEDPAVRFSAVASLAEGSGRVTNDKVLAALIKRSKDTDAFVRRYAIEALGSSMRKSAATALSDNLGDEQPMIRDAAIEALNTLSNGQLKLNANDSTPTMRSQILEWMRVRSKKGQ